ncbi:MAG: LysE family transporter [Gammaproteobacteria bacterium]
MGAAMLQSFLFGAVLAGSIGPIALLILATGAQRGFMAGAFAGLGAALADLCYALVAFALGALLLPLLSAHETAIRVLSGLLLVALGAFMWLRHGEDATAPAAVAAALWPTFLLTLVNPMTLVVFAGFVPQLPVAGSLPAAGTLSLALFGGSLAVGTAIGAAGAVFGAVLPGTGWRRAISAVSALGIVAFGIAGIARA